MQFTHIAGRRQRAGFRARRIHWRQACAAAKADPAAAAPDIPGYVTIKEYTSTLYPAAWTNVLPETDAPGFYRYRLVK